MKKPGPGLVIASAVRLAAMPTASGFTAQLHGLRDGKLVVISNAEFRALLAGGLPPQALGAPRAQAILAIDVASPDQAVAKVRVRIGATQFVDQLSYHRIDGTGRITATSFHIERTYSSPTTT